MPTRPAPRAVLFDVGGPLDAEVLHEQLVDRDIVAAFEAEGRHITPGRLAAANDYAIACFAPDAYASIIWKLARGDVALVARVVHRFHARSERRRIERGGLELRPGVPALLKSLRRQGLLLGLAANQPVSALEDLDRCGIGDLFAYRQVSGTHGFRKPDVRVFLAAADQLGVAPPECVMVGDRIDNDIAPANRLGMRTILYRSGRHIDQQPRSREELPHHTVQSIPELASVLQSLLPPQ